MPNPRASLELLRTRAGFAQAQVFGDRLHVWSDRADEAEAIREFEARARQANVEPSSVRRIVPSLEDVFISKLAV